MFVLYCLHLVGLFVEQLLYVTPKYISFASKLKNKFHKDNTVTRTIITKTIFDVHLNYVEHVIVEY